MIGLWHVIAFFAGAFVGRYFEAIRDILLHVRKDLQKAQASNKIRFNLNKQR